MTPNSDRDMDEPGSRRFTFVVEGQAPETFALVSFEGREAISEPYVFDALLASDNPDIDTEALLSKPARLSMAASTRLGPLADDAPDISEPVDAAGAADAPSRPAADGDAERGERRIHGLIVSAKRLETVDRTTFYGLRLVPRLWLMSLTSHNQIFLGKTLPQIIETVFHECGLSHYELRLRKTYPVKEYVCQYNESHLRFLSRWMEHQGLYYFFEQGPDGEKVVVADTNLVFSPARRAPLPYSQPSGLDEKDRGDTVRSLCAEHRMLPRTVKLKDYNYMRPSLDLEAEARVAEGGVGTHYVYGDHYQTQEEGADLARVRAEELACRGLTFTGESLFSGLRAGTTFSLRGHPSRDMNQDYLVESVAHRGHQTGFQTSGLGSKAAAMETELEYRNTLTALRPNTPYRPARVTERTLFHGLTHAVIDAAESGQYAELDEYGRYKVRLPFDLAGEPDGQASSWLRLAEPFAGSDYGMHFPLHKGVEVLVAFVGGDPDRPVIAGAAHNPEVKNPIRNSNSRLSGIRTAGNNQLLMDDTKGRECLGLWSPYHNSGIAIGSVKPGGGGSIVHQTEGENETLVTGASNTMVLGEVTTVTGGATNFVYAGSLVNLVAGIGINYNLGTIFNYTKGANISLGTSSTDFKTSLNQVGIDGVTISGGYSDVVASPLKLAQGALAAATAGIAAASLGAFADTELFGKNGMFSDASEGLKIAGGCVGSALTLAGAATAIVAGVVGYKACQAFEKAVVGKLAAGLVKIDKDGVNIKINNFNYPQAKFSASVQYIVDPSTIEISPSGAAITLTNKLNGTFTMDATKENIVITKTGGPSITLNALGVTVKQPAGGVITISNDGVDIEGIAEDGPKVSVSPTAITLTSMDLANNLVVNNSGIKFDMFSFDAGGILRIDEAGMVSVG